MSGHPNQLPDNTFWVTKRPEEAAVNLGKRYGILKAPVTDRVDSKSILPPTTNSAKHASSKHAEKIEELTDQLY